MNDAFWSITLSLIVLRMWWKHKNRKAPYTRKVLPPKVDMVHQVVDPKAVQRAKDIADLRKQGYTDEMITTILPVINDGS